MTETNTFRELHQRAILETCDLWDIWSEWHDLTNKKTMAKTNTKTKKIPDQHIDKYKDKDKVQWLTCDIWDIDYNWDNWEPEFMTLFVTWQLRVTLDSIRNSCDVFLMFWILSSLWLLIHLFRVMSWHDLTKKKTMTRTNTKTKTKYNDWLVTFETSITIETIENLNSWHSLLPDN